LPPSNGPTPVNRSVRASVAEPSLSVANATPGRAAPGKAGRDAWLPANRVAMTVLVAGVVGLAFASLPLEKAVVAAFAGAVMVVLSLIDIERGIIPNRIVLPAAGSVLLAQIALFPDRAAEWALAALISAFVFMIPPLLGRAWMGMGDAKLALLLGATLGWGVVGAVLIAFVCVFPVSLGLLIHDGPAARNRSIPFGPFLSLGGLIVLFGPHLAGLPTA
jgi:leader peptidase (prepilin peptidase) / N-methyltransferase